MSSRLLIDTQRNVVLVPTAAVQHGPDSTFAFVVKPDKDAKVPRKVQVGARGGTSEDREIR